MCRTAATIDVPALEPFQKYQLSLLPDGPDIFSNEFFGSQPLMTEVTGEADVLRFTGGRVRSLSLIHISEPTRPY